MNISFSKWVALADRNYMDKVNGEYSGVYLIANCVRRDRKASITDKKIIYIGRAINLKSRLNAFEVACECYYGSHAGGNTLHRKEINPTFGDTISWYKSRGYSKKKRKHAYKNYLHRHPEIINTWVQIRNSLSVAVWTPGGGDLGEYAMLPEEHQIAFVEVNVQAKYFVEHNRLPNCNKRIG